MSLKGIFPPMITPFMENGDVDYDAFEYNVKKWISTGLEGLVVLGSNSETSFLTETEKLKLIEISVNSSNGKTIICGTGLETPDATIELTNKAAMLGANYALILTPNFYKSDMTTDALYDYYTTVADNTNIPILVYNVTKFTGVNIKADLIKKLSSHPNIVGMKDSNGDMPQLTSFLNASKGQDFKVFVGTAGALYPALCLGAAGGVLALANCNPNECVEIYDRFIKGDHESSRRLFEKMFPVNAAVTSKYSIAGLKYACSFQGYKGGNVRKPLQELTESAKKDIEKIINTALA